MDTVITVLLIAALLLCFFRAKCYRDTHDKFIMYKQLFTTQRAISQVDDLIIKALKCDEGPMINSSMIHSLSVEKEALVTRLENIMKGKKL